MQEKMRKRLIIFDFDGTLGDTFERFPPNGKSGISQKGP